MVHSKARSDQHLNDSQHLEVSEGSLFILADCLDCHSNASCLLTLAMSGFRLRDDRYDTRDDQQEIVVVTYKRYLPVAGDSLVQAFPEPIGYRRYP